MKYSLSRTKPKWELSKAERGQLRRIYGDGDWTLVPTKSCYLAKRERKRTGRASG